MLRGKHDGGGRLRSPLRSPTSPRLPAAAFVPLNGAQPSRGLVLGLMGARPLHCHSPLWVVGSSDVPSAVFLLYLGSFLCIHSFIIITAGTLLQRELSLIKRRAQCEEASGDQEVGRKQVGNEVSGFGAPQLCSHVCVVSEG